MPWTPTAVESVFLRVFKPLGMPVFRFTAAMPMKRLPKNGGCSTLGSVQGQFGWVPKQPCLVEPVPA
ncbi:hypothetical protein DUI87_15929 [Hirundo rustica rustica]|uniref:Uncharacterized protein n=1 Tax=Hirundo rustica rustica TaxID=333673 RepID=A0A3M0JZY2_HIRRU|nr:hypothetical protein DUI87_15929 [Hirundo rustica rustica]